MGTFWVTFVTLSRICLYLDMLPVSYIEVCIRMCERISIKFNPGRITVENLIKVIVMMQDITMIPIIFLQYSWHPLYMCLGFLYTIHFKKRG